MEFNLTIWLNEREVLGSMSYLENYKLVFLPHLMLHGINLFDFTLLVIY